MAKCIELLSNSYFVHIDFSYHTQTDNAYYSYVKNIPECVIAFKLSINLPHFGI